MRGLLGEAENRVPGRAEQTRKPEDGGPEAEEKMYEPKTRNTQGITDVAKLENSTGVTRTVCQRE